MSDEDEPVDGQRLRPDPSRSDIGIATQQERIHNAEDTASEDISEDSAVVIPPDHLGNSSANSPIAGSQT
ncbi:unnamed protein product, partial [Nesidiocoris tenuis]